MAKYSYSTYMAASRPSNHQSERKVGYFKLADDGDKAVVRFDYSNPEEFEVYDVHQVKTSDGRYRNVLCLKENVYDDNSKCPMCQHWAAPDGSNKYPLRTKFYVKLIQYVQSPDGSIQVEPKIWERPAGFVKDMKSFIDDYGDLRDVVFIVSRNGARGSRDTKYSINMALPAKYNEQTGYVKDFSGFEGFNLIGHSFMSRNFAEMEEFVKTGEFPAKGRQQPQSAAKQEAYQADGGVATGQSRPADFPAPNRSAGTYFDGGSAKSPANGISDFHAEPRHADANPIPNPPQGQQTPRQTVDEDPTVSRPRRVYTY